MLCRARDASDSRAVFARLPRGDASGRSEVRRDRVPRPVTCRTRRRVVNARMMRARAMCPARDESLEKWYDS